MNTKITRRNNTQIDYAEVERLSSSLNLNKKLVELLFSRGFNDEKSIISFIQPNADNFYDPFLMKGMSEAVERINYAIDNQEKIIIYGDYDADGICANAILSLYLSSRGLDVYSHTPNRIGEDYGLNIDTLEKLIEEVMPDLILTCDCGISCYEEVEFIQDLGVDVIVTDHHEVGKIIPDCTVINPKQTDCNYPFNMLCGAGVALKLVHALGGKDEMFKYLDLCAIATVADLVPLLDENRLIVQLGLNKLQSTQNLGLKALFENQRINVPTSSDIAFKIAPRINAAGRMGDAYRAFELVTTNNLTRINDIIKEINKDNDQRKKLCNEMYAEALEDLGSDDIVNTRAIVLSHPTWEKGITGIVAAKLCGEHNRPAFIMVKSGNNYKGTCRSIEGINVYEILTACSDLLVEFGGHSQAAGFSIEYENIPAFKERVNQLISKYDDQLFLPNAVYDIEIQPDELTYDFVNALDLIEPVGNSNSKPLFKLSADKLLISPCKNNGNHISILLENKFQIFAFSYSHIAYQLLGDAHKELIIELQHSVYGGKDIKGILRACKPSSLYINASSTDIYQLNLLKFKENKPAKFIEYDKVEINKLFENKLYGTLVVANNREDYENFVANNNLLFNEFVFTTTKNNYSRIIVAPDFNDPTLSLPNFEKIIFLTKPLSNGIISYINSKSNAVVYIPSQPDLSINISTDRSVFMKYYDVIKSCTENCYAGNYSLFKFAKQISPDIDYVQLIACLNVFEELGLVEKTVDPITISINKFKVDLKESTIYNFLSDMEVSRAGY